MKITIINGSPRGDNSITYQTCLYLQKKFPGHKYTTVNAAAKIHSLEKDFSEAEKAIKSADLIIFSYPVYTFFAPQQLVRFFELMDENGISLSGKCASQITTSKHFYDTTAHAFVEDNLFDLGANVIHGLSADMDDLTVEKGQRDAVAYFQHLLFCIENKLFVEKKAKTTGTTASSTAAKFRAVTPKGVKIPGYDIVVVCDMGPKDTGLKNMVLNFQNELKFPVKVLNLQDYDFKGGCKGCLNCASSGHCVYSDGFEQFFRENIQGADAVIVAGKIQHHCLGSLIKLYDDRQFCNGHRTVTMGTPIAYLLQGDIQAEPNLKYILEARAQVGRNHLAGIACDKTTLSKMVTELTYALENQYVTPQNFNGVGGMKIFRDLIWTMQGFMKEDHKFYKKNGFYDFPQKNKKTIFLMKLLGCMMRNKTLRKKMAGKFDEGMLAPYKKVIDSVEVTE